jgi:hypothetical protein
MVSQLFCLCDITYMNTAYGSDIWYWRKPIESEWHNRSRSAYNLSTQKGGFSLGKVLVLKLSILFNTHLIFMCSSQKFIMWMPSKFTRVHSSACFISDLNRISSTRHFTVTECVTYQDCHLQYSSLYSHWVHDVPGLPPLLLILSHSAHFG